MTALLIETSSPEAAIALSEKGSLKTLVRLPGNRDLAKNLFPTVQELLSNSKPDYIALGIGPGSYTGTRVGATVAKTLSFALGIPLISFISCLAFLPAIDGPFDYCTHSKYGDSLLVKGRIEKGVLQPEITHRRIPQSEMGATTPSPLNLAPVCAYTFQRWLNGDRNCEDLIYLA